MKPIYVKMKNFGSYKDETVDFSKVDHGIFLITGDTGAGKTTIFDAITYALYDASSGGKRNSQMMVSQFANKGDRTEVEYCFSIGDKQYTVNRKPAQDKYKIVNGIPQKLKTGHNPEVTLLMEDGNYFTGKKVETDAKIKEIIGIDCQQFTQIVMLAQGDFLKLLHADSNDRKAIFSKIFDTYIYYQFEEKIKVIFGELKDQLDKNKERITENLSDIRVKEESELYAEWTEKGSFSEDRSEEIMALIKSIIEEMKSEYDDLETQIAEYGKKIEAVQKEIDSAEDINKEFDNLIKAQNEENELLKQADKIKQTKQIIEKAKKAMAVESDYRALTDKVTAINNAKDNLEKRKAALEKAQRDLLKAKGQLDLANEAYDTKYEELFVKAHDLENSLSKYDKISELEKEYKDAKAALKEVQKKEKELETLDDTIKEQDDIIENYDRNYKAAKDAYNELFNKYTHNLAAILRKELRVGEPCPVCGSIHHEVAADVDDEIDITKEDLEEAADVRDMYEKNLTAAVDRKSKLVDNRNALGLEVEKNRTSAKALVSEKERQLSDAKNELPYASKKDASDAVKVIKDQADKLKSDKETAEAAYKKAEANVSSAGASFEADQANYDKLIIERDELECVFVSAYKTNGFANEEEYKASRKTPGEIDKFEKIVSEYEKAVEVNKNNIKLFEERTAGKTRIDTTELKACKSQLNSERNNLSEKKEKLFGTIDNNKKCSKKIKEYYNERNNLRDRVRIVSTVYNTALGKTSGNHIGFQTYVQRRYFKRVIAAANRRLVKMTGNQFQLRCRDIENLASRGQVGLDLDVYSVLNDQLRDVKSLSGGESFQAALSMALGLSDVIQSAHGKIRIETMFIDEGFGSLSDDIRNQALEMLNELSEGNQLIGIISHVSELKAQVDTKLVVTKSDRGSKAEWVY